MGVYGNNINILISDYDTTLQEMAHFDDENKQLFSLFEQVDDLFTKNIMSLEEAGDSKSNIFKKIWEGIVRAIKFLVQKIKQFFEFIAKTAKSMATKVKELVKKIAGNAAKLKNKNVDPPADWDQYIDITTESVDPELAKLYHRSEYINNYKDATSKFFKFNGVSYIYSSGNIGNNALYAEQAYFSGKQPNEYMSGISKFAEFLANKVSHKADIPREKEFMDEYGWDITVDEINTLGKQYLNIDNVIVPGASFDSGATGNYTAPLNTIGITLSVDRKLASSISLDQIEKIINYNNTLIDISDIRASVNNIESSLNKIADRAITLSERARIKAKAHWNAEDSLRKGPDNQFPSTWSNDKLKNKVATRLGVSPTGLQSGEWWYDLHHTFWYIRMACFTTIDAVKELYTVSTQAYKEICNCNKNNINCLITYNSVLSKYLSKANNA